MAACWLKRGRVKQLRIIQLANAGLKLYKNMQNDCGKTISIWMTTAQVPDQPVLSANTYADVCIVGAGIARNVNCLYADTCGCNNLMSNMIY
ncbi:hypothetical protein VB735_04385 [Halotia wernerae UHCC 0503]|nr:hypothetical protein [Halotia wernerae UHCC 0503]